MGFRICEGWKREVKKLAERGYYKDNPEVTKAIAILASGQLEVFLNTEAGSEDREEAAEMLGRMMKRLGEKREKFVETEVAL